MTRESNFPPARFLLTTQICLFLLFSAGLTNSCPDYSRFDGTEANPL